MLDEKNKLKRKCQVQTQLSNSSVNEKTDYYCTNSSANAKLFADYCSLLIAPLFFDYSIPTTAFPFTVRCIMSSKAKGASDNA